MLVILLLFQNKTLHRYLISNNKLIYPSILCDKLLYFYQTTIKYKYFFSKFYSNHTYMLDTI